LYHLTVKSCTGLTSLDASSATALASLQLEGLDSLQSVALPVSLEQLMCADLPNLADVDWSAAPDVEAEFKRFPAIRLCLPKLKIIPF
jgi:hypothetical protein